jgi:CDP-paratose 2-epimerase
LTGPNHAGVELHGFLSYLISCNLEAKEYSIFGWGGKQVRDNLHASDVADFIARFAEAPRIAEVYNLGGGKDNACSIREAIDLVESVTGQKQNCTYIEFPRKGDHICYYSNLEKAKAHFPGWQVTKNLSLIVSEIVEARRVTIS